MAQFDLDRIFNNAENQSQKKKKKYDIDRILNSAEDISTRNTTMGTIPAITGSAIQATNKIIAPMAKTTTNLTEADLRKIEQNSGLKTGTLNLNKMQAQQQKFENLQQKGNEKLKSGAELINEKQKKFNNFKNDAKIIGSNLKDSALSGGFQLLKTVGMMEDNAYNTQVDMRRILLENTINERGKRGLSTDELKEELNNSSLYKKSDVKPFYQEKINKINQRMAENTEKASNRVTKKIAGLSQSIGNNAVGGVITAISPTAGFAYFTGSAMGSYYDEAVNERGMSDSEARNYATIMGLMEGATEKYLAAENIKGARKIMEGTGLKKSLESFGLEIGENFIQEAVMPAISELATKSIAGNEHLKYDFRTENGWKELATDSLNDGIDGALSAILLSGTTRGVASCVNLTNKARNGGKISKQEIKTAISDAQKSGVNVETILKDKIQENAKKRGLNLENETSGLPQNVQNNIEQQTIQTDTKTAQNQNIQETKPNVINTLIKELDYFETAKKYNIDTKNDTVQSIARVTNERGIKARYDADVFNDNSQNAIWKISKDNNGNTTREVIINPNADTKKSLENIAIHELTHDLEGTEQYNKLRDLILEYDKTKSGYQEARQSLEKLYSNVYDKNSEEFNTLVDSEAVADILGSKLGNQEFVNNLTIKNKNLGQRIYSWVIDKLNRLNAKLGYKSEKIYWTDVKNKFENAFKQEYQGLDTNKTKLSIQQNNNGKYVKADRQVITGNDSLKWETQVENYINNNIRQGKDVQVETESGDILTITKDTAGKAKFRNKITDKNGNTRYLNNKEFLSKLTAETHVDELAQISQKINKKPIPDYKNHKFARDGFDYRSAYFEDFDGQYYKITMSVGKNGSIDTIYNIGKMDKKNRSKSSLVAQRPSDKNITSNEDITSTNSIAPIKDDVNTTTKYSMQESENNSGSFKFDNKGRELSKEQQEYFKNSKVRDENGNLQEVYHGSNTDGITIFDIDKTNEDNVFGKGFYFTDNELMAESYAEEAVDYNGGTKQIYKGYLNIKNPFVVEGENTVDLANKIRNIDYNADIIDSNYGVASTEKMKEWLISKGYDGIEVKLKKGDGSYYVAFNSNQIKKVDNISPTSNSDIRYSQNNKTWQDYLEKNYKTAGTRTNLEDIKINNNIAPIGKNVKRGPLIEEIAPKATTQVKNSFDKNEDFKVPKVLKDIPKDKSPLKVLKDEFIQATVNKGHYVDQLAKQKNNPELTYKYDRNLGAFSEGQFTIGRGQTDNNGKIIGKSVKEIWKPAEKANLVNEFSEYLLYKHNVDRINQNNPLLGYEINAPQSAEIAKKLETKYPQFKEWAKDVYTYYDNELQNFVDAGLITEEFKNQLNEMYPHYVKISRNIENNFNVKSDEKVAGGKNPIKRATGGNSDILPLKETMASYAIQAKKAIRQNELGKEVANTLKLKDVIKKNNKSVYEEIARTNDSNAAADMFFNSINNSLVDNSDGQTKLIYYDDGDIVNVKIDDKLYKSLDTKDVFKDFENSNILTKAVSKSLQKVSKIQRDLLTTYNLGFAMVNPIKDIQDGAFNSKYPGKFAQNYAKAIGEMTKGKKSELYMLYLANGGNSNTYYEYDTKMPTKNYKFGDGINKANEVVETLPRFAEFISTIENGGSINEAMYNAAEITTNFKRGGNFTKFLNRNGANFLNASVQGLSKQIRNITGQNGWKGYAQLITKSVLLGVAPALLNDVLLGDDDEYEELPDYIKDEYYLFKKSDGNFVRIPKGRVLSVIGMTARRTVEATKGNEEAFDNWWSEVVSQMAPNNPLEDNITAPIKAVKDNKTWYGTNIVSSRLQKELPKNQYDETTDEFSKWLGEKINVSPKKINYLIDQYSGGIGDIVLPKITPQAKDNIIQDKFTANSTLKNKNPGKFYELLEETTQLANDVEPVESDVLKAKYLNSVNSDMSKLYKEKRTIQMSDMTQEAKKEAVEEIQSKINSLAEQAINESNNVTTNSNYATVRR